jgi:Fic family protein
MEIYKLRKPAHLDINKIIRKISDLEDIASYTAAINRPDYLFWDRAQYKDHPPSITPEELWSLVKLFRINSPVRTKTPIRDEQGVYFTWQQLLGMDFFLHEVDLQLGGFLETTIPDGEPSKRRFISRGIMEEAIASSQLEGANTTRKAAKKMLLEKRKPRNRSEKMILNNYQAMIKIESILKARSMSKAILVDLHATLVEGTVEDSDVGRFRSDNDKIIVSDPKTDIVYHIPPSEKFLKTEIDRLIDFANDDSPRGHFVHPIIKAIMLHFWLAYLHPFTDGNGRLARVIFYWYALRKNYRAFSYLPISRVIRSSPAQYRDAYVYTEQDDNDLTYFIDFNIRKIKQAKNEFESYITRKEKENRFITEKARSQYDLNDRQIQLLRFLYKNTNGTTTIKLHSQIYGISRMTARKDLENLEELRLLSSRKVGRDRLFAGTEKIVDLFW